MPQTYGALCALAEKHGVKMTEEVRAFVRAVEQADAAEHLAEQPYGWCARFGNYFTRSELTATRIGGLTPVFLAPQSDHRSLSAVRTLERMRYTYSGAELWKPPLGKPPVWVDVKIAIPDDWPTNQMIDAGRRAADSHGPLLGNGQSLWHVFRDMIAAANNPL
ncbi:hypothetical protein ABNQ24_12380 [Ralstonia pseudosolanacearum]|uniref:hypothetical protein n=1 Tax=Ralstonia pseudosolanacearum TaxID=1310165 RepID=UPI00336ABCF8